MAKKIWTGTAQDVCQVDTITIAGDWSAGSETLTVTCNNKSVTITTGTTMTTTTLVATGLVEALNATSADNPVEDMTFNRGGQEYGEFQDFVATFSGSVVTLTSAVAGTDFEVTVDDSGSAGTATLASVTAATGKNWIDNADNFVGGVGLIEGDADELVCNSGSVSITRGLANIPTSVSLLRLEGYKGDIGLPEIVTTNLYPYTEYRRRFALLEPTSTTGTLSVDIRGGADSGVTYLDFGVNVPSDNMAIKVLSSRSATRDGAAVQLVGGRIINLIVTEGSVSSGATEGENPMQIYLLKLLGNANVYIGTNGTFENVVDTVVQQSGTLTIDRPCADVNNEVRCFGGTMMITSRSSVGKLMIYGGRVDYRGSDLDLLYVYAGEFDATLCSGSTTGAAHFLFAGSIYRDPMDAIPQEVNLVGCGLKDVTLQLRKNKMWTPTAASAPAIE